VPFAGLCGVLVAVIGWVGRGLSYGSGYQITAQGCIRASRASVARPNLAISGHPRPLLLRDTGERHYWQWARRLLFHYWSAVRNTGRGHSDHRFVYGWISGDGDSGAT